MASILFLSHRLPYPPNKGDKLRSFHILEHLASRHRVFLGTFIDDPKDASYLDRLRPLCAAMRVERIIPVLARLRSLKALAFDEPLSIAYYGNRALARWVDEVVSTEQIEAAVIFSSPMFQFVAKMRALKVIMDFVDVDSSKWAEYAKSTPAPLSWIYRREGSCLLRYERAAAASCLRSLFVTEAEAELFRKLAPESASRTAAIENGVDSAY